MNVVQIVSYDHVTCLDYAPTLRNESGVVIPVENSEATCDVLLGLV